MKGKENIKNSLRRLLVGVFAVSLFAAFATVGLAEVTPTTVAIESPTMTFTADGSTFNLEANALFPANLIIIRPISGRVAVTFGDPGGRSVDDSNQRIS